MSGIEPLNPRADRLLVAYTVAGEVFERLRNSGASVGAAMHQAARVLCAHDLSMAAGGGDEVTRRPPMRTENGGG